MRRSITLSLLIGAIFLLGWQARARGQEIPDVSQYTRETFVEWFNKYKDAKPEFKPGDVLTHADLEKVRPFMLPGYFEQYQKWDDGSLKMEVVEPKHLVLHKLILECNEKYQKQVRVASDGALENYVCGQPFANEDLKPEDPQSSMKAAWNYDKRWYWKGYFVANCLSTWIRFGGSHTPPEAIDMPPTGWYGGELDLETDWRYEPEKIYGGGGRFERNLGCFYHKAYYSHMPMYPENNYLRPGVADAKEVFWKEFTGFFSPYDVRGTAFIIKRYEDPRRADDAWAYVPSLRRVRRVSAEVKSDSLMGTEHTLEDFYGFNGRPLEWDWKLWGWKDMLAPGFGSGTKWDDDGVRYGGPDGWLNDEVWSLRKFAIFERIPKDPRHPYKSALMAIDAEVWETWSHVAFDRKGKLWKIWQWGYYWSEDAKRHTYMNHGRQAISWRNVDTVDIQNGRGNLWRGYGTGLPDFSLEYIARLYDLNRLTELHR